MSELTRAARALAAGGVIAYPTETLFGLGCDPEHEPALARLHVLKGRPTDRGLILLVRDQGQLAPWVTSVPPLAERLLAAFWPGPLTLVLPARPGLSPLLTGGRDTLAVRCSPAPLVRALLALWPKPVTSTSANRHGEPPVRTAQQARELWRGELDAVIPGPLPDHGLPSTVLEVRGEEGWLLRRGAVSVAALRGCGVPLRAPDGTPLR